MDKRFTALVLSVLILSFAVTGYAQEVDDVKAGEQNREKPSLTEIAGGCLGWCVGGYGVGAIADQIIPPQDQDLSSLIGYFASAGAGCAIGAACGVWAAGTRFGKSPDKGSFRGALIGSLLGYGIGVSVFLGGFYVDNEELAFGGYMMMLLAPPIGAILGYNRTRRYDSPPAESETALINVRDSQISLAVPRVYFRGDRFGRGGLSQNIDLLRVRF